MICHIHIHIIKKKAIKINGSVAALFVAVRAVCTKATDGRSLAITAQTPRNCNITSEHWNVTRYDDKQKATLELLVNEANHRKQFGLCLSHGVICKALSGSQRGLQGGCCQALLGRTRSQRTVYTLPPRRSSLRESRGHGFKTTSRSSRCPIPV